MPLQIPPARARQDSPSPVQWLRHQRRLHRPAAHRRAMRACIHVLCIRLCLFERCSCPESRLSPRRLQLAFLLVQSLRALCSLCKCFFFAPPQNGPLISPSNSRQIVRRIHRRGLSNGVEHPLIVRAISIRKASLRIQTQLGCDSPDGPRLRFAKHGLSHDASSPAARVLFQACSTNPNLCRQSAFSKLGFQPTSRFLCQRLKCPTHNHNLVSALRMPRDTFDRLRIKWDRHSCLSPSFFIYLMFREETDRNVCPTAFHIRSHASQIHFVCMHDLIDSSRYKPHRFREPQRIIPNANELAIPQRPKKPPLQRRQRHQRTVQIKKRRDSFALLLYFYFLNFLYSL